MSQHTHPLTHYTGVYGVSYRTILRWKEKGYPLDDEAATRLLAANPQGGPQAPRRPRGTADGQLGLLASIERLREAEEGAHRDYVEAIEAGAGESVVAQRLRAWTALTEQLRKTELSNPEVERENRNSVPLPELKAALGELFARLRIDLEELPRRVALELVGRDELSIRAELAREVAEIVAALYGLKYLGGEGGGC